MADGAASLEVLGPLRLLVAGVEAPLHARKVRQLLASLSLAPGIPRSRARLVEALWGDAPPRSADKVLQQYVSQLRAVLPPEITIRTSEAGYALELDPGLLDASLFQRLVAEGGRALREGDHVLAAASLRRALALWQGSAFQEFEDEGFFVLEAARLDGLRLDAMEDRLEADLALGRHTEVLSEVRALAAAQPLRERLSGLAMVALYRAGMQGEALEAYRGTRQALVDELGVEPGSQLQDLHRRVLSQDEELASPVGRSSGAIALPSPVNPLRGREHDLAALHSLLRREDVRLLVLTGAGGSGKTRLAIEAARIAAPDFAHGCVLVELAALRNPAALMATLCSALGVPLQSPAPLADLVAALQHRELLLVLDNVEQLRAATPDLVELLRQAPRVRLLVTSRVVLHLSGEHVYPVDPLPGPAATALFLERAREAGAAAAASQADEEVISRLCSRLDNLPLAIELAASQLRTLTPLEVLTRLETHLPGLAGGPHDLPARQQTLQATLQWSYEQLDGTERRALARISVFADSATFAAVEAVCDVDVDVLAALVDHHLVTRTVTPSGSRYSMLETVREFAHHRLVAAGELDQVRRRHAEHALALADTLGLSAEVLGTGVPQRHAVAVTEQANLRTALDWAETNDPLLGLRLMLALIQFWVTTAPREGARRFEALLERAGPNIPPDLHARALCDLGGATEVGGDWQRAAVHYERSFELFEQLGDALGSLMLRHRLANIHVCRGDVVGARSALAQALALAREGGHGFVEAELLMTLSTLELQDGEVAAAYGHQVEALFGFRAHGGWPWGEALALANLAELAVLTGSTQEAEVHGRDALRASRTLGDRISTASALGVLAAVAVTAGDDERAGRLWGAVEAEQERGPLGRRGNGADLLDEVLACPSAALQHGRDLGRQLRLDEAVRYALDEPTPA